MTIAQRPTEDGATTTVPPRLQNVGTSMLAKAAAIVTGIVTALAGTGAVGTSYLVEKTKLRAQREALEAKQLSDSEDRKDKNASTERELRTKYVDLALQSSLGVDHRARIFGYLATVMETNSQREWAQTELKRIDEQRAALSVLRRQLDAAIGNSSSGLQRYVEAIAGNKLPSVIAELKAMHENELEQIRNLRERIQEIELGSVNPGRPSTEPTPPTKSR